VQSQAATRILDACDSGYVESVRRLLSGVKIKDLDVETQNKV
jgi:hypothetical protein